MDFLEWIFSNLYLLGALLLSTVVYLIVYPAPSSNMGRKIDATFRVIVSILLFSFCPLSLWSAFVALYNSNASTLSSVRGEDWFSLTFSVWYPLLFLFLFKRIISKADQAAKPKVRVIVAIFAAGLFAVVGFIPSVMLFIVGLGIFLDPAHGTVLFAVFLATLPGWSVFAWIKMVNGNDTPAPKIETPATGKEDERMPFWNRMKVQQKKMPSVIELVLNKDKDGLVSALNNKEININEPYPDNGNTPLHIAAWNGYAEIVQLLLTAPAIDKTLKNKSGQTALDLAKQNNHTDTVRLLQ